MEKKQKSWKNEGTDARRRKMSKKKLLFGQIIRNPSLCVEKYKKIISINLSILQPLFFLLFEKE